MSFLLAHLGYIMGRFRSVVRRFVKPAAMVTLAGGLAFSLVITTPSNAHALVTYPKIPPAATFVMGATKTVAPVAMAAASFTPVGLGLRLAFLAFSTADLWVPLVTEAFGQANKSPDVQGSSTVSPTPGFILDPMTATSSAVSTFVRNTTTQSNSIYWVKRVDCKNNSTNVVRVQSSVSGATIAAGNSVQILNTCNTGETPVGGSVSPECSLAACAAGVVGRPGPQNITTYGTLAPPGFDPRGADVGYQGRSECIDALGTISWVEGPITPGNNDGGTMVLPSCEKAGKGHGTGRTMVKGFKPDGTTTTVWDTGTKVLSDPATPLCDPGRAGSGCVMEITKDGQPCKSGDVECENWLSESAKDSTGTRWKCRFGPYTLALSACGLLERAYVPGGSPLNDPNTDGNPDTRSPLGPDGSTPVAPAPTGTVPGTPPGGAGQPAPGDADAQQCFPGGWAMLNPMWIVDGLRCAFIPKTDVKTRVDTLQATAQTKAPLSWFNPTIVGPGGGGCPNWTIHAGGSSWSAVCDSSFTAAIVGSRNMIFGMLSVAMVWPLLRSLWYAAIPILRVTPSSGGK